MFSPLLARARRLETFFLDRDVKMSHLTTVLYALLLGWVDFASPNFNAEGAQNNVDH
jgi:hypothetical protein